MPIEPSNRADDDVNGNVCGDNELLLLMLLLLLFIADWINIIDRADDDDNESGIGIGSGNDELLLLLVLLLLLLLRGCGWLKISLRR